MNSVDVCLCTFRRASVLDTLRSLAGQEVAAGTIAQVIVADNDEAPSAHDAVTALGRELGLPLRFVHAPARNISIARNACLAAATAPLVAFIDDDETAPATWLASLLATMDSTGAAVVLGPVRAHYADDAPAWVRAADLHATRPARRADGRIDTGYSCNVLFRRDIVGDSRFDPALGRTGGEDDLFFSQLFRAGHRIEFAPGAWLDEAVPAQRARLGWLLRRSFRNGQTFGRIQAGNGRAARTRAGAVAKLGICLGLAAAGSWSAVRWRRAAVRGALHAGVLAQALGKRDLELY